MTLKFPIEKDPETGEECVPPEIFRILMEFGQHRQMCDECAAGWKLKTGRYCATGRTLWEDLLKEPGVELLPD